MLCNKDLFIYFHLFIHSHVHLQRETYQNGQLKSYDVGATSTRSPHTAAETNFILKQLFIKRNTRQ